MTVTSSISTNSRDMQNPRRSTDSLW